MRNKLVFFLFVLVPAIGFAEVYGDPPPQEDGEAVVVVGKGTEKWIRGSSKPLSRETQEPREWQLRAGNMVSKELVRWGEDAGWKVIWNRSEDVVISTDTAFVGVFRDVAAEVVSTLAANGLVIRAVFHDGNQTLVVTGAGVKQSITPP